MRITNNYNMNRIIELDCLRGIAALLIMLFHYTSRYEQLFGHNDSYIINFYYGKFGVQFFLITSGFILMNYFKNEFNQKEFIIKRICRLYPAYIICITLTFIILSIYPLEGRTVGIKEFLINLTMLQGFLKVDYVEGAHWYLTIEIIFIMWSCIFLKFITKNKKSNVKVLLYIWLCINIIVRVIDNYMSVSGVIKTILLINYSPFFIIGLAFYNLKQQDNIHDNLIISICLWLVVLQGDYRLTIATIFLIIIFNLLIHNKLSFIINRTLTFIGGISYSLYLIHQNVGYVIINYLEGKGWNSIVSVVITGIILIGVATIISYNIEKPMLKIIKRWLECLSKSSNKGITISG